MAPIAIVTVMKYNYLNYSYFDLLNFMSKLFMKIDICIDMPDIDKKSK